jgi:hypothetical protein
VLVDEREHLRGVGDGVEGAGRHGRVHLLGDVPGRHLVTELLDGRGRRADPDQPRVQYRLREGGVLGQEAVAGVHGVSARAPGDGEDLLDDQVGFCAGRAVKPVCLIGEAGVQGVAVLVGVDGDREDAAVLGRSNHSDGDLATVGDEDLRYTRHRY